MAWTCNCTPRCQSLDECHAPRSVVEEADEVSICNYCGEEIPYSDEPAWCSEACREADAEYAAADARADLEIEAEV